jgi:hypothetical protein
MTDTPPGWVADSGLDADSAASMTADEAKEYLTLVVHYVAPNGLPSLAWLRRTTAPARKPGDSLSPCGSEPPDAADPAPKRENALGLLHGVLRDVPVSFQPSTSRSLGQRSRRPRSGRPRRRARS